MVGAEIEAFLGASKTLEKANNLSIAKYHIVDGSTTTTRVTRILKKHCFAVISENSLWTITYG